MKRIVILILFIALVLNACDNTKISFVTNAGSDTVEMNTNWIDTGASLWVNNQKLDTVQGMSKVDTKTTGLYKVEYEYEYRNQTFLTERYVMVVDTTAPTITLVPGVDSIQLGSNWIDAGTVVIDNSGETIQTVAVGSVDTSNPGTYQIVYSATDSSGNQSSIIRYVTVFE